MTAANHAQDARTQVRVNVDGTGAANVATGVSVLDHLLVLLAAYASFDLALEVSDEPLLVSHVDLSEARLGGVSTDIVAAFLRELCAGASLTLHVRLLDGSDAHHVLKAIFKALGTALAQACRPRRRKE